MRPPGRVLGPACGGYPNGLPCPGPPLLGTEPRYPGPPGGDVPPEFRRGRRAGTARMAARRAGGAVNPRRSGPPPLRGCWPEGYPCQAPRSWALPGRTRHRVYWSPRGERAVPGIIVVVACSGRAGTLGVASMCPCALGANPAGRLEDCRQGNAPVLWGGGGGRLHVRLPLTTAETTASPRSCLDRLGIGTPHRRTGHQRPCVPHGGAAPGVRPSGEPPGGTEILSYVAASGAAR